MDKDSKLESRRSGMGGKRSFFRAKLAKGVEQLRQEFSRKELHVQGTQASQTHQSEGKQPSFSVKSVAVADARRALTRANSDERKENSRTDVRGFKTHGNYVNVACHKCGNLSPTELLEHLQLQSWYQNQVIVHFIHI